MARRLPICVSVEDDRVLVIQAAERAAGLEVVAHGSAPVPPCASEVELAQAVEKALAAARATGRSAIGAIGAPLATASHVRVADAEGDDDGARVRAAMAEKMGVPALDLRLDHRVAGTVQEGGEARREVACVATTSARIGGRVAALRRCGLFLESLVFDAHALRAVGGGRPVLWIGEGAVLLYVWDEAGLVFARDLARTQTAVAPPPGAAALPGDAAAPPDMPLDQVADEVVASLRHLQFLSRRAKVPGPLLVAGPRSAGAAAALAPRLSIAVEDLAFPEGWVVPPELAKEAPRWAIVAGLAARHRTASRARAPGELLHDHVRHARAIRSGLVLWLVVLGAAVGAASLFDARVRAIRSDLVKSEREADANRDRVAAVLRECDDMRERIEGLGATVDPLEAAVGPGGGVAALVGDVAGALDGSARIEALRLWRGQGAGGIEVKAVADHPEADAIAARLRPLGAAAPTVAGEDEVELGRRRFTIAVPLPPAAEPAAPEAPR